MPVRRFVVKAAATALVVVLVLANATLLASMEALIGNRIMVEVLDLMCQTK